MKYAISTVLGFFLLLSAPGFTQESLEQVVLQGRQAITDRNPTEAMKFAERAQQISPGSFESLRLMGRALGANGEHKSALSFLERALHMQPDDLDALRARALVLFEIGETDKAWTALDEAIEKHPEAASLYYNRAYFRLTAPDFDQESAQSALDDLTVASRLEPDEPEILDNRAWVLSFLGRYEEAVVDLLHSIASHPNRALPLVSLGELYLKLNKREKAIEALQEATTLKNEGNLQWAEEARQMLESLEHTK